MATSLRAKGDGLRATGYGQNKSDFAVLPASPRGAVHPCGGISSLAVARSP